MCRDSYATGAVFRTASTRISPTLVVLNPLRVSTLGMRPSPKHLPIVRYVAPSEFDELRQAGKEMGFSHVEAGPLVRSSYHADEGEAQCAA